MMQLCTHQPTLLANAARPVPPILNSASPTSALSGCQARSFSMSGVSAAA